MPRKLDDSGILIRQAHKLSRRTICNWNRYLARDPPSYDSGTLLSEADAKTIMDKIEARRKWLKANGKACGRPPSASYLGKHQRVILARVKSKADVTMESEPHLIAMSPSVNVTEHSTPPPKAHMFVQKWFKAKAHEVPNQGVESGLPHASIHA